MSQKLTELGGKLEAKRTEWMNFYQQFEVVGDAQAKDMTGEDLVKFKAYEKEVLDFQAAYDQQKSVEEGIERNRELLEEGRKTGKTPAYGKPEQKSLGDILVEKGFSGKGFRGQAEVPIDAKSWLLQQKATMTTSANGYPPQVLRDGTVVPIIQRPPQFIDYLRIEPTDQNAIKFMKQTVRTNAAAAKNEGSALDESTITYAESTDIISRIGTFIPVTQEQLEDEPELRTLVEQDLAMMVKQVLDEQVTVGSGVDPILLGVYASTNYQTQSAAAIPPLDAWLKAMNLVRINGRAAANVAVMHGTDHTILALTRTADGLYILGNPSDGPIMRVWGIPIALSEALTVTNGFVCDTDYFRVKMRKGVEVAISDSHASNFISNILVLRAHIRAGIKHMRGEAVCRVTSLPAA
jgi:HK97 family phage major capsid protein